MLAPAPQQRTGRLELKESHINKWGAGWRGGGLWGCSQQWKIILEIRVLLFCTQISAKQDCLKKILLSRGQSCIWVVLQKFCNGTMTDIQCCVLSSLKEGSKKSWDKPKSGFIEGGHPPSNGYTCTKIPQGCLRKGTVVYTHQAQKESSSPGAQGHCRQDVGHRDGRQERQTWPAGQIQSAISFLLARLCQAPQGYCCALGQFDGRRAGWTSLCLLSCSANISLYHGFCFHHAHVWGAKWHFVQGGVQAAGPKGLEPSLRSQHMRLSPDLGGKTPEINRRGGLYENSGCPSSSPWPCPGSVTLYLCLDGEYSTLWLDRVWKYIYIYVYIYI